jgi:peptidoglycan endopeptidase LytE
MNYTVLKGDTLGTIAQKLLGSSARWREIWTQNPSITDPNKLSIGQIIRIPAQSSAQTSLVPVAQPVQTLSPASTISSVQSSSPGLKINPKILALLALGGLIYVILKNKTRRN